MGEVKQEISKAIETLGLREWEICLLAEDSNKVLYHDLLDFFVKSGDRRWWWEDFKLQSFNLLDYDKPFEHLNEIIPDLDKNVWLMVEDDQESFYPIYDCSPKIISQLIGECFGFEYYVIDKNKGWLICENHHNRMIGVGDIIKAKNIDKVKE